MAVFWLTNMVALVTKLYSSTVCLHGIANISLHHRKWRKREKMSITVRRERNCIAVGEGSSEVCLDPTRPDFQHSKGDKSEKMPSLCGWNLPLFLSLQSCKFTWCKNTASHCHQFESISKLCLPFSGFHGDGKTVSEQLVLRHRNVCNAKTNTDREQWPPRSVNGTERHRELQCCSRKLSGRCK